MSKRIPLLVLIISLYLIFPQTLILENDYLAISGSGTSACPKGNWYQTDHDDISFSNKNFPIDHRFRDLKAPEFTILKPKCCTIFECTISDVQFSTYHLLYLTAVFFILYFVSDFSVDGTAFFCTLSWLVSSRFIKEKILVE